MRKLVLSVAFCLLAAPAQAIGIYGELITSGSAFLLPENIRATLDAEVSFNPFDIQIKDWSVSPDTQMGSGWVSSGEWLSWTHTFEPGKNGAQLEDAWLFVTMGDYSSDKDTVEIHLGDLGGAPWKTEEFYFFEIAGGNVLGAVKDNQLVVSVHSVDGVNALSGYHQHSSWCNHIRDDGFKVKSSLFKAKYTDGSPPIPEPHAVLAFGLGAAIMAGAIRRRSLHR